jgi:hypothetical protein
MQQQCKNNLLGPRGRGETLPLSRLSEGPYMLQMPLMNTYFSMLSFHETNEKVPYVFVTSAVLLFQSTVNKLSDTPFVSEILGCFTARQATLSTHHRPLADHLPSSMPSHSTTYQKPNSEFVFHDESKVDLRRSHH